MDDERTLRKSGVSRILLLSSFLMGIAGVWVAIQILDLGRLGPSTGPIHPLLENDRVIQDALRFKSRVKQSRYQTAAVLETHLLTYENLLERRMRLGMRLAVNQSLLSLGDPPVLPALPPSLSATSEIHLSRDLDDILFTIRQTVHQIESLQSRFEPLSQDIRNHLLKNVTLQWDPDSTEVEHLTALSYNFSALSNDPMLRNYYFEVIRHHQLWLTQVDLLLRHLGTLPDLQDMVAAR